MTPKESTGRNMAYDSKYENSSVEHEISYGRLKYCMK